MQSLLFEKPTKRGGFEGANDIDEQGSQVATVEATLPSHQLQTNRVLFKEDSSSVQPEGSIVT